MFGTTFNFDILSCSMDTAVENFYCIFSAVIMYRIVSYTPYTRTLMEHDTTAVVGAAVTAVDVSMWNKLWNACGRRVAETWRQQ